MTKSFARGTAATLVLAGLIAAAPAMAHTHHHRYSSQRSTAAERQQTRDLNLQQLALAQGQAPANMMANAGTTANSTINSAGSAVSNAVQPATSAVSNAVQPATNPNGAAPTNGQAQPAPAQNPDEQTPNQNTNTPQQ